MASSPSAAAPAAKTWDGVLAGWETSGGTSCLRASLLLEGAIRRAGPGILRFQLVQEARNSFRLKLVTTDADSFAHVSDAAVAALREPLRGASVVTERHDELPPDPSGKFRPFVLLR